MFSNTEIKVVLWPALSFSCLLILKVQFSLVFLLVVAYICQL